MANYSIFDIANWFLSKGEMSPKKLQKITYYAVAWGHALLNESIVHDTEFEAWVHGPVSPELYFKYKEYGWTDIEKVEVNENKFDEKTFGLLEAVWVTYGDKSANELEALTHDETPWRNARKGYEPLDSCNEKISDVDMKEYYSSIYIGD